MTLEERLHYCKICTNRKMDQATGIVCGLTDAKPAFENECPDFQADEKQIEYYKNRKQAEEQADDSGGGFFEPEKKGLQKGVLGGIAMMVIAAVWFVLGWQAGYIYYYPPILFIIGLVGLIKGIAQGNISGKD
ncbi:MAG: hypothetical protein HEP71_19750 [Roseivirga sp.]|nr:hypothetical protein [Roseivirga sp.]